MLSTYVSYVEVNGETRAGMYDRIGMHSNKTCVAEQEGAQLCDTVEKDAHESNGQNVSTDCLWIFLSFPPAEHHQGSSEMLHPFLSYLKSSTVASNSHHHKKRDDCQGLH